MGQSKEAAIMATTTVSGMIGGNEELPNSGEGSTWDTIMGLAPLAMGLMGGPPKTPVVTSTPVEVEKSPVKKKSRISLPVNISKK